MTRPALQTMYFVSLLIAMVAASVVPAAAQDGKLKGVVELFTSQGCSSCPPADKILGEMAQRDDVVALSYHVDYWNYLGWRDTFSSPESTERQYNYARTLGRKSVYTPQVIVNGRDHLNGSDRQGIEDKMDAYDQAGRGLTISVEAEQFDDEIRIKVGAGSGKANIIMVYFERTNTVDVKRGENRGRQITYWHSVNDMQTVAMWDGEAMELVLPRSLMKAEGHDGCAILLQTMKSDGVPGAIIGADILLDDAV